MASESITVPSPASAPAKIPHARLPLLVRGDDPKEARGKAIDALAAVGLDQVALKKPAELSGGQQQRVAIARALVNEPDIVFADEPTGNLDSETSREVVELMKSLHAKKGLTFIVVTHDGAVGNQMQRVIVMRNGGILKSFRPTPNLGSMPTVDRVAPRYQLPGAVVDTSSQLFDPAATVIGFDATRDLGNFVRSDGSTWNGSGLSGTEAIINANLATSVEAKVGHGLVVSLGTPRGFVQIPVTVKEIVRDEGRGAWNDGENLFVPLPAFQAALGESGKINTITVANDGGATQGYLRSDDVVREMTPFLPAAPTFTIAKVKADSIDGASRNIDQLSQVFVLLGFFTVIAGILLIINIFVMLAEERKGEMGVARALGMRRTNLVQSFVSEGLLYALLSSVIGTFTGLLVAGVILWGFSQVFGASAFGGTGFLLHWSDSDLINGFAIGFLITMATIVIASWRVSKLNIVRAIRDIPEPIPHGSTRRQVAAGAAIAVLGAIGFIVAVLRQNLLLQDLGPVGLAFGLAALPMRAIPSRPVLTAACTFIAGWVLSPWKFFSIANADITLFIAAGLMLVLGGLLIVLFNSDSILALATRLVRRRTWRPVVRTAIAYPMNKKFRTGATLASIALVMFTIAPMSGIQAEVSSSITTTSDRESGGFELLGASGVPIPNWDAAFAAYNATSTNVTENHGLAQARVRIASNANLSGIQHNTSLIGVPINELLC